MVDNPLRETPTRRADDPARAEDLWQEDAITKLRETAEETANDLVVIAQQQGNPGAKGDLLRRAAVLYTACSLYDAEARRHERRKTPDVAMAT